jgi:hypothetical protein
MNKNALILTVVVADEEVHVEANENAPLRTVIPEALKLSGNAGRQPEDWQLKRDFDVLNLDTKIKDFQFEPGMKLFMSLKAGILG